MSKVAKTLFGGTDRSAQRAQMAQNDDALQAINQQGQIAQDYLSGAKPEMQRLTAEGFQGAANLLQGAVPQQLSAISQGNVAAQQYLLGGMPAFQNALMGSQLGPVQQPLQPTQIQTDASFLSGIQVPR